MFKVVKKCEVCDCDPCDCGWGNYQYVNYYVHKRSLIYNILNVMGAKWFRRSRIKARVQAGKIRP